MPRERTTFDLERLIGKRLEIADAEDISLCNIAFKLFSTPPHTRLPQPLPGVGCGLRNPQEGKNTEGDFPRIP